MIDFLYEDAFKFNEGLASVTLNGEKGFINKSGEVVIEASYDYAYSFRESLSKIEINGKHGFINNKGDIVIPAVYIMTQTVFLKD